MAVQISGNDITVPRDTTVTRNLTVGGVLTYEDVTNVDSVGLVTARSGIEIGARPGVGASISVDGNAIFSGITTATTLRSTTGIVTTLTATGLTVDSGTTNTCATFQSSDAGAVINLTDNSARSSISQYGTDLLIISDTDAGDADSTIKFQVDSSTKAIIDSSGKMGLGTNNPTGTLSIASGTFQTTTPTSTGDDIVISGNQSLGIQFLTLASGTSNNNIYFGDTDDPDIGMIRYAHSTNSLEFQTNGSERARIDSSGRLLLGTTNTMHSSGENLVVGSGSGEEGMTIYSGSTSGGVINFADGTSGSARYDGRIYYTHDDSAPYMRFMVGTGAERFRIDYLGQITSTCNNNGQIIHKFYNSNDTSGSSAMTNELHFNFNRTSGSMSLSGARIVAGKEREWIGAASNQDGFLAFYTTANETPVEKMRILSGGNVYLGDSVSGSGLGNSRGFIFETSGTQQIVTTSTGAKNVMEFGNPNGNVGRITTSGSSTTYYNSSDYRLKENATTISDGITRLKTLIPRKFSWKVDSTNTLVDGFFAHEVTAVPEAISGVKDEVYTEDDPVRGISKGDPLYQMIDQSKLVPLLTAALQEAVAKIETLEAKVTALEGS